MDARAAHAASLCSRTDGRVGVELPVHTIHESEEDGDPPGDVQVVNQVPPGSW